MASSPDLIANGTKSAGGSGAGKPISQTTSGVEFGAAACTSAVVGVPGGVIGVAEEGIKQVVKSGIKAPSTVAAVKKNLDSLSLPSVPGVKVASKAINVVSAGKNITGKIASGKVVAGATATESMKTVSEAIGKSGSSLAVKIGKFPTKVFGKILGGLLGKMLKLFKL